MLFMGTTAETDAALRAMKHVATAGGRRVPPLDPSAAADGRYPDSYQPSA
jgi:hypothetical protein